MMTAAMTAAPDPMPLDFPDILFLSLYIHTKKNGTNVMPSVIATIIPKNTPVPMFWRLALPGPVANTRGSMPRMKARDVITIGLNLRCAAVTAASSIGFPFSTSSLANSTMRMAFFATSPTSITSPIWKYTLLSRPTSQMPRYAPAMAIGRERITAIGTDQLSYWAASTRNTNRSASPSTSPVWPPSFFS